MKGNIKTAMFTALIVAIVVLTFGYIMPDMNVVISAIISGLSAFIGWRIGERLFKNK